MSLIRGNKCEKEQWNPGKGRWILRILVAAALTSTMIPLFVSAQSPISGDELDTYIEGEFEKTQIPAMSVEVVDAEEILFSGDYGEGTDADTPFILGSISKSFTALAIMQLVEQGKVKVDEVITSYLPDIDVSCNTTVKQLLNHTSGIHTNMTLENFTTSETVADYEYANVNYDLLGLIVEKVSGMPYGEYIKKNIFEPLGMKNSYVSLTEAKEGGIADGYRNYFGMMVKDEFPYPENMTSGWMTLSAAYLISTPNDMGKYLQFYLGEDESILTNESKQAMFSDTTQVIEGYEYGYGWGISRTPSITMYLHGGNVENYTTYMVLLPDQGKGIIVLTNACDFFAANDMVVTLSENIGCKLADVETVDLDDSTYAKTHILLDVIMLLIVAAAI